MDAAITSDSRSGTKDQIAVSTFHMIPSWWTLAFVMVAAFSSATQNTVTPGAKVKVQPDDQSPYAGMSVQSPESLTGLWEAPDGHEGAIGIHLLLTTTVPATAKSLVGTVQSWQHLEVRVYERKKPSIGPADENGFSDSKRGGSVTFDRDRLRLHFVSTWHDVPSVDLDLVQSGDRWVGRFHRGSFDSNVSLRRPSMTSKANALLGTWQYSRSSASYECLHIAQTTAHDFTGWFDSLQLFGNVHIAPNMERPSTTLEEYGELLKVGVADNAMSFELPAYTGICCSSTFVGRMTPDSSAIRGAWRPDPNQTPQDALWVKVRGGSCPGS
jgi:hypothetical protein